MLLHTSVSVFAATVSLGLSSEACAGGEWPATELNELAFAETNYIFRGTFTVEVPPRGDAPDWVYRAWLGLKLPYTSKDNHTECINVVDLQQQPKGHYYLVPDDVAIKILERRDPEAAAWWRANNYPRNISFCFPDDPLLF